MGSHLGSGTHGATPPVRDDLLNALREGLVVSGDGGDVVGPPGVPVGGGPGDPELVSVGGAPGPDPPTSWSPTRSPASS